MRDPFVGHVVRNHPHYKQGQLAARWGGSVPLALWLGIEVYDRALERVMSHDLREERKRREAEAEARKDEAPGTRWPVRRRR